MKESESRNGFEAWFAKRFPNALPPKEGTPEFATKEWMRVAWDAAQSETGTWIKVEDRLPSPHTNDDVIVATRTGFVCALRYGEEGWYDSTGGEESGKDGYWNGCVTHWQPLPKAPDLVPARTL